MAVDVVVGVVVADVVLVEMLVDAVVGAAVEGAARVESGGDDELDDARELRAVGPDPPHALSVKKGSATESAVRSQ